MKDQVMNVTQSHLESIVTNKHSSLFDLSKSSPVLLIFLRHFGCIFCKEALNDLATKKEELTQKGVKLVFVHMSDPDTASTYFEQYDLSDFESISDPDCKLYQQFGLTKGNFNQLFGLKVMLRGFEASVIKGNSFSFKQIGDGFQMPGIFLIRNGEIVDSYVHQRASDKPDYNSLISCCAA